MEGQLKHLLIVVLFVTAGLLASPAHAQRVFVAAQGSDANPCTFAAPCRSFQHAHNVVAAGGEIDVLDPGGYGAVTITKAISIQGHGFSGVSVGSGGTAITISAGANDAINLTGLLIEGAGIGQTGIHFTTGKSLTIESCIIRNLTQDGIDFNPSASSALSVLDSVIADIGNDGINVSPTGSGTMTAAFTRIQVQNVGAIAIFLLGNSSTGTIYANVTDSAAINFGDTGFRADASTAVTHLTVIRSLASNGFIGVRASGNLANIRLGQSTVTGTFNAYFAVGGGSISTYGDNNLDDNSGSAGALTPVNKQ